MMDMDSGDSGAIARQLSTEELLAEAIRERTETELACAELRSSLAVFDILLEKALKGWEEQYRYDGPSPMGAIRDIRDSANQQLRVAVRAAAAGRAL